ncbi:MAG: cell division protein ZapA [bacterium]
MTAKTRVEVNVFGKSIIIQSELDHEYIKEIAEYVDQKMDEINSSAKINSEVKLAILASLNIAEEMFRLKKIKDDMVDKLEEKSSRLINLLTDDPWEAEVND